MKLIADVYVECEQCNGTGENPIANVKFVNCESCGGEGTIKIGPLKNIMWLKRDNGDVVIKGILTP